MFCNKSMWTINKHEVELFGTTNERAQYNKIWLGLRVNADRKNLQDIAFYLDFKDLPDHHKYYSMMSELEWQLDEKPLNIKSGFSSAYTSGLAKSEREILDFYKDHYQTLVGKVDLKEEDKKKVPTELEQVIGDEMILPTTPMHWISIKFPSRFKHEDVEKISIFLNAVPVINREYNKQSIRRQELDNTVSLASGVGEQFLEIDSISDSRGNLYENSDSLEKEGTYTIESIERQNSGTPIITDSLERLADMVQDKRTAFPNMDYEKIVSVLSSLTSITNNDDVKSESNRLRDYADVALFNANPATNASTLNAHFWTSYADLVNGIEAGTSLMANKIHELNKIDAILLTPSSGGRNFYTPKSLKAISNFYLGSKNRILTKHNILNFCWAEFAEYLERVDVVRKASVGSSLKEGIIIVMEIQLQPKSDCNWYFEQKSTLKDFIVRLYRISPNNFNYQILIL